MTAKSKSVVTSFSYPIDANPVIVEFSKIADKEGKSCSQLIVELILEYVQKHSKGNPGFDLLKWVEKPTFMAFPTLGEDAERNYLKDLDDKMLKRLIGHAESWLASAERERDKRFRD